MEIKLTREKIYQLRKEYANLKRELDRHHDSEHGTILESMKEAAANTVSIGAKTSRMKEIEWILKCCEELPDKMESKKATIGSRIKIEVETGQNIHYRLVHPIEADPVKGYISVKSPLGRLLVGSRLGSIVKFNKREFKVISLS